MTDSPIVEYFPCYGLTKLMIFHDDGENLREDTDGYRASKNVLFVKRVYKDFVGNSSVLIAIACQVPISLQNAWKNINHQVSTYNITLPGYYAFGPCPSYKIERPKRHAGVIAQGMTRHSWPGRAPTYHVRVLMS